MSCPGFESLLAPPSSSSSSSVPSFFGPSLHRHYAASSLLRPLLTSPRLSPWRSPQVRCRISPLAPPGSTRCVLMIFGLRCSEAACRPHHASLPVRVPAVESLLSASFSFASRLRLAVQLRLPSSAPIGSFHPTRFCPCWAHSARVPLDPLYAKRTDSPLPNRPTGASAAVNRTTQRKLPRTSRRLSVASPTYRLEPVVV